VPLEYLAALSSGVPPLQRVLAEARRRKDAGRLDAAARALTTLLDLQPGDECARNAVAIRFLEWELHARALPLLRRTLESRPFEPQPWLEAARAFDSCGAPGPAAVCYEVAASGRWDERFRQVGGVVEEEYREFLRRATARRDVSFPFPDVAAKRLIPAGTGAGDPEVSVVATWSTDNTDVDLWVVEPGGEKCFYGHRVTGSGGRLSDDLVQGYGPERYATPRAAPGGYRIYAHFFQTDGNRMGGTTCVRVTVKVKAGTAGEQRRSFSVFLEQKGQVAEVCRIRADGAGGIDILDPDGDVVQGK
jgi:hypothetical protein